MRKGERRGDDDSRQRIVLRRARADTMQQGLTGLGQHGQDDEELAGDEGRE